MTDNPIIIGISGGSGSGKSRLASRIYAAFPENTTLIEQDWYYHDLSRLPPEASSKTNFDHPSAVEHTLLLDQLCSLALGETVLAPGYHYSDHRRIDFAHALRPKALIVVEGLFALYWPEIRSLFQIKVFLRAPAEVRFERRLERDRRERGYSTKQIRSSWSRHALPMHEQFVEPTSRFADRVWETHKDTAFESEFLADLRGRLAKNGKIPE